MNDKNTAEAVLTLFGLTEPSEIKPYGRGLINHTWIAETAGKKYILQRINEEVFHNPPDIAYNIQLIGAYLEKNHPDYLFLNPLKTVSGDMMASTPGGWFRLFPFIEGSHTLDVVKTPQQAFEAAQQFGKFSANLADFRALKLKITLPEFHNLDLRYKQFEDALLTADTNRKQAAKPYTIRLKEQFHIVDTYNELCEDSQMTKRVTHHDTKISNVLLDEQGRGLCVIDLDTLMPGYFISDFGDMMRTYLSPVNEEEKDFSLIEVRDEFYWAIRDGYLSEMRTALTETEKRYVYYSGIFMTYMQALRFLTDFLNSDIYYGAEYPEHNLVRAGNQYRLLQCLLEKESELT